MAALAAGCARQDGRSLAADQATARRMVLSAADLPPGWTPQPADRVDDHDLGISPGMARCFHVHAGDYALRDAKASSPLFADGRQHSAQVKVVVAGSAARPERRIALFRRAGADRCVGESYGAELAKVVHRDPTKRAIEIGQATATRLPASGLADDDEASFRVTVPLARGVAHDTLYVDLVFLRVGRVAVDGSFASQGRPFDEATSRQLTRTVLARAPAP